MQEDNENLYTNANKQEVFNKAFTKEQWTFVEKVLSEDDRKRNEIIANLGNNLYNINNNLDIFTIGDYIYNTIRPLVEKELKLPKIDNKSNAKMKINKKTQMILDNTNKIIKSQVTKLLDLIKNKLFASHYTSFNHIEMRILYLIATINHYLENNNVDEIEELSIACHKIYDQLQKENRWKKICNIADLEITLSPTLLNDFKKKLDKLDETCNIRLFTIANKKPKLIYTTKYDDVIPNITLKPYDTQVSLIDIVKNNMKNGFMVFYKTLPGLGKTSMILALCNFVKKEYPDKKVIFCCSDILETVRMQVLRIMYNFKVKFGIGIGQSDNAYQIINSWACKNDAEREMIVADYITTYLLLEESKNNEYIVFFDEPTINTHRDSAMLNVLARILYNVPKYMILSSATLPNITTLDNVVTHYKSKYSRGVVEEIISNKTLIGCTIKDFDDNMITPHNLVKTPEELKLFITKIKNEPLIGKFYTLQYLINLNKIMERYKIHIDLGQIHNFDHESVLENILILLDRATQLSPEHFNIFLKVGNKEVDENVYIEENQDDDFDDIVPEKFLTTHAFKYVGGTLIACNDPLDYVKTHFYPVVEDIMKKQNIKSIHEEYVRYMQQLSDLQQKTALVHEKFKNEEKRLEELEKLAHIKPQLNLNEAIQINTPSHIKTFSKYVKEYDRSLTKKIITFESIDITDFHVDDRIKFLLYMGVGIYSRTLPSNYTAKVLEMLQDRQLAYIVADETFCYGANYQISNVIMYDDLCDNHSMNTVLQLIGRTGRVGKSWYGKVYMDNNTTKRFKEFIIDNNYVSEEAMNIRDAFNKYKSAKDNKLNELWEEEKDIVDKPKQKMEITVINKGNIPDENPKFVLDTNYKFEVINKQSDIFKGWGVEEEPKDVKPTVDISRKNRNMAW